MSDRGTGEEAAFEVGYEHTQSDLVVTMYRHSTEDIDNLLKDNEFELLRCLEFPVPMDIERTVVHRGKAYVVRRKRRN